MSGKGVVISTHCLALGAESTAGTSQTSKQCLKMANARMQNQAILEQTSAKTPLHSFYVKLFMS